MYYYLLCAPRNKCLLTKKKPTTGLEPVNLILTKDVLYQLSYMGNNISGQ
jgi:hypothetical protein